MSLYLPGTGEFPEALQREVQEIDPNLYFRNCGGDYCRVRRAGCKSWVLLRSMEDGMPKALAHSKTNHTNPSELLPKLRERYGRNAPDTLAEVEKHNATLEAERAAKTEAAAEETAQRIWKALN